MNDLAQIQELNRGYIRSVQQSDGAWFERNLAADFVNQNPDCSASDREAFIAFVSKPCAVSDLRAEDVRIQMLGEVAIVRARTAYTKPDGSAGQGRYTDVWQRRDGRWLCVCADVTRR